MKFRVAIFCLLALTAVTGARAQDVTVDFVKSADFSQFKTYSWAHGVPAKNYLIDQQIRAGIEERLATKGLSRVEQGGDLSVIYVAAVNTDVQVATSNWVNTGNWMTPIASGISVTSQMWEVEMGTLVVCLSDASGKNLLWRGAAKSRLNSRSKKRNPLEAMTEDAKKTEGKVKRALEKMFKQYPAGQAAR
ncbi:MAG TPA: DUF4136 domain-containing protein [Pyrinomonadaceae bacterium]